MVAIPKDVKWYLVVLFCICLITDNGKHLLMYLLAFCLFHFVKYLSRYLFTGFFILLLLTLYNPDTSPSSYEYTLNIFPNLWFICFLHSDFWWAHLVLMKSNLSFFFSSLVIDFSVLLKKSLPTPIFPLCIVVLGFTFKFVIQLQLTFRYGVGDQILFFPCK